jgi:hypothetical protein
MPKQTSVEWLIDQFELSHSYINEIFKEDIAKAKQIHKEEQIIAFNSGRFRCSNEDAEDFYNETYGGQNGC